MNKDNDIDILTLSAHETAKNKGFHDDLPDDLWNHPRHVLSMLALVHTEVSEATEAVRKNDYEGFRTELADIVIRVLDIAGAFKIPLHQVIVSKMEKNLARPRKHDGKRL